MKTIAFFNNKGGVGKTSLVYHLAWMMSKIGHSVLAVDLDPQSNLTSAFLEEQELEKLWPEGSHDDTILGALQPLIDRLGDIKEVKPKKIHEQLHIMPGDLGLSVYEDRLSEAWSRCTDDNKSQAGDAFRVITSFYRIIIHATSQCNASIALIDVGPNVGSLNRAAMVASDNVVIPLGADLFSIQGLMNLGPTLRDWRNGWKNRKDRNTVPDDLSLPDGSMTPLGYVLLNPSVRENRPVKAYEKWVDRIPKVYIESILGKTYTHNHHDSNDSNCLAMIKHYKSLMPLAQDARKPMFQLTPKDGAIGGHASAVSDCYKQFNDLANIITRLI